MLATDLIVACYWQVDAQRVFKVSRLVEKDGSRGRKEDSKLMMKGLKVLSFLR
jgi:hypothetical protein